MSDILFALLIAVCSTIVIVVVGGILSMLWADFPGETIVVLGLALILFFPIYCNVEKIRTAKVSGEECCPWGGEQELQ
jgi:hypothetical protein